MSHCVVTGGAGFIGSHFCRLAIKENWFDKLTNIDSLTYAGNLENLSEIYEDSRYKFFKMDLNAASSIEFVEKLQPDTIVHFAAESHVDRSIEDPTLFLNTNIIGTFHILEAARRLKERDSKKIRFVMVSTDEVYGSLGADGQFYETTPLAPRSPYSVSKASADMLSTAYFHTYGLDSIVVRCSNNYGPHQFPEKLIPQTIILALQDKPIPVYGTGENVRDWIFVEDFVRGVKSAHDEGSSGEAYNFGGDNECQNIKVVKSILSQLNKPDSLIRFVEDRKGHDFRYAMNFERAAKELKWRPQVTFQEGLKRTVQWYVDNKKWWKDVRSGAYKEFFEHYYGKRLEACSS